MMVMVLMNNLTILWILYYSLTLDELVGSLEKNGSNGSKARKNMNGLKVIIGAPDDDQTQRRTEHDQVKASALCFVITKRINDNMLNCLIFIKFLINSFYRTKCNHI
ncbi:hypothetical protein HanPSC8_Chr11g0466511 [Helianthus annuus]|nr:hypothetical protein HanPSC8_Chr11g0466511 [Helianthus annuus]